MVKEYVRTLYGRGGGVLRLDAATASAELSADERAALTEEAAAHGWEIVFETALPDPENNMF